MHKVRISTLMHLLINPSALNARRDTSDEIRLLRLLKAEVKQAAIEHLNAKDAAEALSYEGLNEIEFIFGFDLRDFA